MLGITAFCTLISDTILILKPLPNYFLRFDGVSHLATIPFFKMQILFPMNSASSICYVETRIALYEPLTIFLIRIQIFSRTRRSRLEVGSSSMINLASPISAIAIDSFLLSPGERNLTCLLASFSRNTS